MFNIKCMMERVCINNIKHAINVVQLLNCPIISITH